MKFNSQICTSRSQSERLLALGLKKETADMCWVLRDIDRGGNEYSVKYMSIGQGAYSLLHPDWYTPAWSLHRLIEMMPQGVQDCSYRCFALAVNSEGVSYEYHYIDEDGKGYNDLIGCTDLYDNLYDDIMAHIEWLIKEDYFDKEYLEE